MSTLPKRSAALCCSRVTVPSTAAVVGHDDGWCDNRWLDVSGAEFRRQDRQCGLLSLQPFDHVLNAGEPFLVVVMFHHDGASLRR